jgi:arylsulfatase A-like enzyme
MTPLEESIRVPMMIWGGRRYNYRPRTQVDYVINHVDVPVTTLGLCGLKPKTQVDGYDYSPIVRKKPWGDPVPACADAPEEALLQCVVPTQHGPSIDLPWRGIVTRDGWKYVALEGQPLYLYNLNEDPYELHNMAHHAHAKGQRRALNERLRNKIAEAGDSFTLPAFTETGSPVLAEQATAAFKESAQWYERNKS